MPRHQRFLTRLISLVDYAEKHGLSEAALVLTAATEVIAPTLRIAGEPAPKSPRPAYSNVVTLKGYKKRPA